MTRPGYCAALVLLFSAATGATQAADVTLTAEVWVDNWYAFYANGEKVAEDSTPYRTERSFNADRFTFTATTPLTLAFEFRDFMQDDTGLEYIGSRRQQMGDGGAIAQFTDDATGRVVAVTDRSWACTVIHHAPDDPACARERNPRPGRGACTGTISAAPAGWAAPGLDTRSWPPATEHSAREVRPKDGYDRVRWTGAARLIWGPDLHRDNIVLCRLTLGE